MSTVKTTNLQHASAGSPAIVLDADGDATYAGTHDFSAATVTGITTGKILQVVSVNKIDVFSTSSTTLDDVTGLTATITPSQSTSKVFVMVTLALTNSVAGGSSRAALIRDSTQIGGGTGVGSRGSANGRFRLNYAADSVTPIAFNFLDSPASISAITYKIQIAADASTSAYVNYSSGTDNDHPSWPRLASSITLFEVAA